MHYNYEMDKNILKTLIKRNIRPTDLNIHLIKLISRLKKCYFGGKKSTREAVFLVFLFVINWPITAYLLVLKIFETLWQEYFTFWERFIQSKPKIIKEILSLQE